MGKDSSNNNKQNEQSIRDAEKLIELLESPYGAQQLGDEAYKTAQEDAAKRGKKL